MNILLSNDDGLHAAGLDCLAAALKDEGHKVFAAAPATQMSGASHSITTGRPFTIRTAEHGRADQALEISGTPADCVKLGIKCYEARGIPIDMVFSGINHGSNLGTDTLYSGTVAAAIEGALCGRPAVAVSIDSGSAPAHLATPAAVAVKVLQKIMQTRMPASVININTPDVPYEALAGIRTARLGRRDYVEGVLPDALADGVLEYSYHDTPVVYDSHDDRFDVIAVQDNYAVITPLGFDLTDEAALEPMKEWRMTL